MKNVSWFSVYSLIKKCLRTFFLYSRWFFLMLSLCFLFRVARRSRQRNGKRCLPRSPESRERAKPGGHGGRGLDAARPEASEGCLLFFLGQPSRQPQKEEEQEQTQVHNPDMNICVSGYLFFWNLLYFWEQSHEGMWMHWPLLVCFDITFVQSFFVSQLTAVQFTQILASF